MLHAREAGGISSQSSTAEADAQGYFMAYLNRNIRDRSLEGFHSTTLYIPRFIWAMPYYNRDEVIRLIMGGLLASGYKVEVSGAKIKVRWPPVVREMEKKSEAVAMEAENSEVLIEFN